MASIRNLKKDIDYLLFEVISDSYTFKSLYPDNDHKEADNIILEAVDLRNHLIQRINHPDGKDNKKMVKTYYKNIINELLTKTDGFFERLNALLAKK